jgi:hypothetical protein
LAIREDSRRTDIFEMTNERATLAEIPEKVTAATAYLLFFLIVLLPAATIVAGAKIVLLGVLLVLVSLGAVIKGKFELDPAVALLTCAFATFGFLLVVRGWFSGAPGATNLSGVHAVWPLVYLALIGAILRIRTFRNVETIIAAAAALTGILAVIYLLSQLNFVPAIPHFDALLPDEEAGIGFFEGYVRMNLPGINSLGFVVPFLMATIVMTSSAHRETARWKVFLWTSLLLSMFVVIVSGRRAITLDLALAPVLILFFGHFFPVVERRVLLRAFRRFAIAAVLGVFLLVLLLRPFYTINFSGFFERFFSGFDFSATSVDNSPDERRQQYFALVNEWYEHPVLGAGLGEPAYGSVRSDAMPWAYELSYLALLSQTGLLGVTVYGSGIAWIYWMAVRIFRAGGPFGEIMLPLIVGTTCFLIANATNPYLAKFDGLWTLFLPLALINRWRIAHRDTLYARVTALPIAEGTIG